NTTNPVIVSTAYLSGPISTPTLSRGVKVKTKRIFPEKGHGAMMVTSTVDFSGGNVFVNSFDSTDPNYSTGGMYDPNKAKENGDVTTLSTNVGAIKVGNGRVEGSVHVVPSSGTNAVSV